MSSSKTTLRSLQVLLVPVLLSGLSACSAADEPLPPETTVTQSVVEEPTPQQTGYPTPTAPVPLLVGSFDAIFNVGYCIPFEVNPSTATTIEVGMDEYQYLMRDVFEHQPYVNKIPESLCVPEEAFNVYPEIASQVMEQESTYLLTVRDE